MPPGQQVIHASHATPLARDLAWRPNAVQVCELCLSMMYSGTPVMRTPFGTREVS